MIPVVNYVSGLTFFMHSEDYLALTIYRQNVFATFQCHLALLIWLTKHDEESEVPLKCCKQSFTYIPLLPINLLSVVILPSKITIFVHLCCVVKH